MHRPTRPPVDLPAYRPPSTMAPLTKVALVVACGLMALVYVLLFIATI